MFLCRTVAGAKYGLDVDAMLADIEPWQFDEWQNLYDLEPWGNDWWQAAAIQAAVMNANRSSGEGVTAAELIPTAENLKKNRTDEVDDADLASVWKQRLGF